MPSLLGNVMILRKYKPEEYAAFWGGDPVYDNFPRFRGDGYLFYNFGSEFTIRDAKFLANFKGAIKRTISCTLDKQDIKGLTQLLSHVESLKPKTVRSRRAA
jgi:hypothetical protein